MSRRENEGEKERKRKRGLCPGPVSQAAVRQTQKRTYIMKGREKAPWQNVDEERQGKISYMS